MKKHIAININLNNPSERAIEEINKALDNMMDDLEHLLPKGEMTITYLKD